MLAYALFARSTYSSWSKTATIGTPEYYGKQMYTGGARCWNGPERSVTVSGISVKGWIDRKINIALLPTAEPVVWD